jgi:hypothetical protein
LQSFAGKVAINTATNGGNFEEALTSSLLSVGTGYVGSEVAAETGSKILGQTAASTLGTVVRGGNVNLESIGANLAGNYVGSEIGSATGSDLAGKAASTVTKSLIQGKDATAGLIDLGINELGNATTGQITSFVDKAGDAITSGGGITSTDTNVDDIVSQINSDNNTKDSTTSGTLADTTGDTTTGGLSVLSDASLAGTAGTTEDKTDLNTSKLSTTGATDTTNLFGSGADNSFALTGGNDIKAVDNAVVAENNTAADDAIVGGLNSASAVTNSTGNDAAVTTAAPVTAAPVTGGLTQAQQDLIANANDVSENTTVTGGLNQTAATGDTTGDPAGGTTATTAGATGAKAAGSNILGNILKKTVANTASGAAKNLIKKAAGQKTTAMPSVAKQLTSSALNQMRSSLAPKKVDVSKLTPVAKKTVPLKTNVSNLTPVGKISGLTSLIKVKG